MIKDKTKKSIHDNVYIEFSIVRKMFLTLTRKFFKRSCIYCWRNFVTSWVSCLTSCLSYSCSCRNLRTTLISSLGFITQGTAPSQVRLIKIVWMQRNSNTYLNILVLPKIFFLYIWCSSIFWLAYQPTEGKMNIL